MRYTSARMAPMGGRATASISSRAVPGWKRGGTPAKAEPEPAPAAPPPSRPRLEEVGHHGNGETDADAGRAHDYASRRDTRSETTDHYDISDCRYRTSRGGLVTGQKLITEGDELFAHRPSMGAVDG